MSRRTIAIVGGLALLGRLGFWKYQTSTRVYDFDDCQLAIHGHGKGGSVSITNTSDIVMLVPNETWIFLYDGDPAIAPADKVRSVNLTETAMLPPGAMISMPNTYGDEGKYVYLERGTYPDEVRDFAKKYKVHILEIKQLELK